MTATESRNEGRAEANCALWLGMLGPPIVWLVQFQSRYAIVSAVCEHGNEFVLHILSLFFLLLTLGAGCLSWVQWQRLNRTWPQERQDNPAGRQAFMAVVGLLTSGLFSLLIIAQALPTLFLSPCTK